MSAIGRLIGDDDAEMSVETRCCDMVEAATDSDDSCCGVCCGFIALCQSWEDEQRIEDFEQKLVGEIEDSHCRNGNAVGRAVLRVAGTEHDAGSSFEGEVQVGLLPGEAQVRGS